MIGGIVAGRAERVLRSGVLPGAVEPDDLADDPLPVLALLRELVDREREAGHDHDDAAHEHGEVEDGERVVLPAQRGQVEVADDRDADAEQHADDADGQGVGGGDLAGQVTQHGLGVAHGSSGNRVGDAAM